MVTRIDFIILLISSLLAGFILEPVYGMPSEQKAAKLHRKVRVRVKEIKQVKFNNMSVSVISESDAQKLFKTFENVSYMPFKYVDDGCYARAHEFALIAKRNKLRMGKAFIRNIDGSLLYPQRLESLSPSPFMSGFSGWKYHVTAFLFVENSRKELVPTVFDVGVLKGPVSVDGWQNELEGESRSEIIYRDRRFVFEDGHYESDGSIIYGLIETQHLIDELGEGEYLFRLQQGWL